MPALQPVVDEVYEKLKMYGSIGRGFSPKSDYSTDLYNNTRDKVLEFVGADPGTYTVFYVNNTTDGLNKLASALIEDKSDIVLTTRIEHHSNDLPWRETATVIYAEVDDQGRVMYDEIEEHEKVLNKKLVDGLLKIDNAIVYGDTGNDPCQLRDLQHGGRSRLSAKSIA